MTTNYDPAVPIVPDAPGVPPLNREPGSTPDGVQEVNSDGILVNASKNVWGIFRAEDNQIAVKPDSIVSVEYDAEYRISDFQLQDGQFETYNKVAMPFETRVVLSKGGAEDDRRDFVRAIEDIRGDTALYNVVTPEWVYLNVNIARVSLARKRDQGGGLIEFELVLREIRENYVTPATKEPGGEPIKNNGTIQARTPAPATEAIVASKAETSIVNGEEVDSFLSPGRTLMEIATVANRASQLLTLPVRTAVATIALSQRGTGLYADIGLAGQIIAAGVLALDGVPLLNNPYLGFPGDLAIFDTQGSADPDYTGLGSRFKLLWAMP